jgi:hypothetical protein
MATATVGLTYTRVNLSGQLFHLSPNDTPLLSAIGGNMRTVDSKLFIWQTETNTTVSQPSIVEGADPSFSEITTQTEVSNCVQIFQKGMEITYTNMAANGMLQGFSTRTYSVGQPVILNWLAHQLALKVELMKKEIEFSMLRGEYQYPTDNNTGRKMRGLKDAISTYAIQKFSALTDTTATFANATDLWTASAHGLIVGDEVQFTTVGTGATGGTGFTVDTPYWVVTVDSADTFSLAATKGGTAITGTADSISTWTLKKATKIAKADLDTLMRMMAESTSAPAPFRRPVLYCGAYVKQALSEIYGFAPMSRTEGGVAIDQIVTDFIPRLGVVFDRWMHPGDAYLLDLSVIRPVNLPIPGHPALMAEKVAQTGAAERWQLYTELGLEYGPEQFHGKITGLTTAA